MAAMEEQWEFFVATAKDKADSHTLASRFWGSVDTFFGLSLIFLSGKTKIIFLWKRVVFFNSNYIDRPTTQLCRHIYLQKCSFFQRMKFRKQDTYISDIFCSSWPILILYKENWTKKIIILFNFQTVCSLRAIVNDHSQ